MIFRETSVSHCPFRRCKCSDWYDDVVLELEVCYIKIKNKAK